MKFRLSCPLYGDVMFFCSVVCDCGHVGVLRKVEVPLVVI